jgi:predicted ATPase
MLRRFLVNNFKSLMNIDFRPSGINLLVGSNNSGKTNLCHAIRFLGMTSAMSLDEAASVCTPEPWNFLNVYTSSDLAEMQVEADLHTDGEELSFAYTLQIVGRRQGVGGKTVARSFRVEYESLRVNGGPFNNTVLLENKAGKVRLLHETRFLYGEKRVGKSSTEDNIPIAGYSVVETSAPTDSTMLFRLYDLETNRRANLFKKYLSSWSYYSLDPSKLRSNAATFMDRMLKPDGSNLCSVLYTLHNLNPREEKKLVEAVRVIEPKLDIISFQAPDPEHVYMFFEDSQSHKFGVQSLSEGTLRYLAISFLIIENRKNFPEREAAPLILIEEPETGIFVGLFKPLFEKLDPSGSDGQFVFTSHNPYFIDLFDSSLEGLHMLKFPVEGSVLIKPDIAKLRERLGKFSLGDMHFRGLLE